MWKALQLPIELVKFRPNCANTNLRKTQQQFIPATVLLDTKQQTAALLDEAIFSRKSIEIVFRFILNCFLVEVPSDAQSHSVNKCWSENQRTNHNTLFRKEWLKMYLKIVFGFKKFNVCVCVCFACVCIRFIFQISGFVWFGSTRVGVVDFHIIFFPLIWFSVCFDFNLMWLEASVDFLFSHSIYCV